MSDTTDDISPTFQMKIIYMYKFSKITILNFPCSAILDRINKVLFQTNHTKKSRRCLFVLAIFTLSTILQFYYNTFSGVFDFNITYFINGVNIFDSFKRTVPGDITTYALFKSNRHNLTNLGEDENPKYSNFTPVCHLNISTLGPISVNKTELELKWVEEQYPEILAGGFYAPKDCRSRHIVAVLVTFRNRKQNLNIFLYYIHRLLKKQLLQYRIFVIEQFGTGKFNKGSLYNAGFIESQRFGRWHCLIFHDVDLIPLDERILYSCTRQPTHMSPAVENLGYRLPYKELFGGVTSLSPKQYESVNGYSNNYWDWGAEDDDMFLRLKARRYPILRYSREIGKYASLPHAKTRWHNWENCKKLYNAKKRYQTEGLNSLKYKLVNITKKNLFTHILVDIKPLK